MITRMKTKRRGLSSHISLKEKAHKLLQLEDIQTTQV